MSDEPSNFALSISEAIQREDSFSLTEEEILRLSPYERAVLGRTALRYEYRADYEFDTGKVSLTKDYSR